MTSGAIIFESVKLLLQFFGAIVIAWLAVRWALRRYKSEKAWEHRLSAYTDALRALAEMRAVLGEWFDEEVEDRKQTAEVTAAQRERYQTALRQVQQGTAAGLLILPESSTQLLAGLTGRLRAARAGRNYVDDLDAQYAVLNDAIKELIAEGRKVLGPELVQSMAEAR